MTELTGDLLGPTAVADEKTKLSVQLEILVYMGYVIKLAIRKGLIARKVDLSSSMSLPTAQRLATWGSRYSMICHVMRPFCIAQRRLSHGRKERQATFIHQRRHSRGWRAMLCLVNFDELRTRASNGAEV